MQKETKRLDIDEFDLAGDLVCVTVEVEAEFYRPEYREFEGHGVVCTYGAHAVLVSVELVLVDGVVPSEIQASVFPAAWSRWLDDHGEEIIAERMGC